MFFGLSAEVFDELSAEVFHMMLFLIQHSYNAIFRKLVTAKNPHWHLPLPGSTGELVTELQTSRAWRPQGPCFAFVVGDLAEVSRKIRGSKIKYPARQRLNTASPRKTVPGHVS